MYISINSLLFFIRSFRSILDPVKPDQIRFSLTQRNERFQNKKKPHNRVGEENTAHPSKSAPRKYCIFIYKPNLHYKTLYFKT